MFIFLKEFQKKAMFNPSQWSAFFQDAFRRYEELDDLKLIFLC